MILLVITSANNKSAAFLWLFLPRSTEVEIGTWFGSEDRGVYGKHFGPVYSVKRNPFHPKFFLSVGDWCGKMWMEELKGAVKTLEGAIMGHPATNGTNMNQTWTKHELT